MAYINQLDYPNLLLGFGTGIQTVKNYGCYMCSLLMGLQERGYNYSVEQFNQLLKDKNLFSNKTSLSAGSFPSKWDIFTYGANEAWSDADIIKYLNDKDYIVVGEVDPTPIGGSGQHFVYIRRVDVNNNKVGMTYIGDPAGKKAGDTSQSDVKVTLRYNGYGNIKSLRVFKIKQGNNKQENNNDQTGQQGNTTMDNYKGIDLNNKDSIKVCVDLWKDVMDGVYIKKDECEQKSRDLQNQINDLNGQIGEVKKLLNDATTNYNNVKVQVNTLNNSIVELNNTISAKDTKISQMSIEIANYKAEIKTLQSSNSTPSSTPEIDPEKVQSAFSSIWNFIKEMFLKG